MSLPSLDSVSFFFLISRNANTVQWSIINTQGDTFMPQRSQKRGGGCSRAYGRSGNPSMLRQSDGSQVRQGSDSAERVRQSCQEYCIRGLLDLSFSHCPSLCGFFWETTQFNSTTWLPLRLYYSDLRERGSTALAIGGRQIKLHWRTLGNSSGVALVHMTWLPAPTQPTTTAWSSSSGDAMPLLTLYGTRQACAAHINPQAKHLYTQNKNE